MSWRIFGLLVMLTGIALFALGVWLEFAVQARVGTGAWKLMAQIFEGERIEQCRRWSVELMVAGPLVYFAGHVIFHVLRRRRHHGPA